MMLSDCRQLVTNIRFFDSEEDCPSDWMRLEDFPQRSQDLSVPSEE